MKRTQLANRQLPCYSHAEEMMNTITHIIGVALGIAALGLCLLRTLPGGSTIAIDSALIYGLCMITLYAMSSIYHALKPGTAKKVMQIIDHCTIYLLIAGSYTPVALVGLRSVSPVIGWGLFIFEWVLAIIAVILTAIDLKKYRVFSMICYIGMGWAVLPFLRIALQALTKPGFLFLLFGGIAYTIGAILYGIGSKKKWFHCIFHIFVLLGSLLQLVSIAQYAL